MEQQQEPSANNPIPPQKTAVISDHISPKKRLVIFFGFIAFCILSIVIFISVTVSVTKNAKNQNTNYTNMQQNSSGMQATVGQTNFTQDQIVTVTGSPLNTSALPVGDNRYTTTGPKKGYIYLCRVMQGQGGAQVTGNWIHGTTWNLSEKPHVSGSVAWPNAMFDVKISGTNRVITGDDLPIEGTTGIYPIQSTDSAYRYDRNLNSIKQQSYSLTLPTNPTISSTPSCIGGEVGVMSTGIPLFNGFDAENRDAAAHEVQDSCDGHPQESGEYHYHSLSSCIKNIKVTDVIGYALDGFPITGPVLENGNYLTTNDLDECHGITSTINLDARSVTTYHYVMTEDFPYSVSCFRGKPVSMQVIANHTGGNMQQGGQAGMQQGGQMGVQRGMSIRPPQEAYSVCSGKSEGDSCSFTAPRGQVSGTCQMPDGQTMVCAPSNPEQNQGRPINY